MQKLLKTTTTFVDFDNFMIDCLHTLNRQIYMTRIDIEAQENPIGTKYKEKLNDGFYVYVPRRLKIKDSFIMVFQEKLEELAIDGSMTATEWRVFSYVVAQSAFENFIHINQTKVSEKLGVSKANISRAFKRLIDLKIIEKITHDNISGYRLNYEIGWKGKASNLKSHMKDKRNAEHEKIIQIAKHAREAKKAAKSNDVANKEPEIVTEQEVSDAPTNDIPC
jgi:predicted transcriptional regulator